MQAIWHSVQAAPASRAPVPRRSVGAGVDGEASAGAFRQALAAAAELGGGRPELKDAATRLVSSALVLPALAGLHDSPLRLRTGPFAQSTVEKRFGPLLDQQIADRVTQAANFGLVNSIVARFEQRHQGIEASTNPSGEVVPQADSPWRPSRNLVNIT